MNSINYVLKSAHRGFSDFAAASLCSFITTQCNSL